MSGNDKVFPVDGSDSETAAGAVFLLLTFSVILYPRGVRSTGRSNVPAELLLQRTIAKGFYRSYRDDIPLRTSSIRPKLWSFPSISMASKIGGDVACPVKAARKGWATLPNLRGGLAASQN